MSSRLYKTFYVVFNILALLLGVYTTIILGEVMERFDLYNILADPSVMWEFENLISIVLYIFFMIKSLLNIVTKKQYDNRKKTILFRILSILIWVVSVVIWIKSGIKGDFVIGLWLLITGVFITLIIMILSLYYLFNSKKTKYSKLDVLPILITLVLILLIFLILDIYGRYGISLQGFSEEIINLVNVTVIDYMGFIIIPVQLVNIYNLFNLKSKK